MRVSNLGYPRIGRNRELKTALEKYFEGESEAADLLEAGRALLTERWNRQFELGVESVPLNDFSFFDHMIDMSLLLGVIPKRFDANAEWVRLGMEMGRGSDSTRPLAVRKWFNTNYHYLVPEIGTQLASPRWEKLRFEWDVAQKMGKPFHPVLVGPWTFVKLATLEGGTVEEAAQRLLPGYVEVLKECARWGVDYVQMDEPHLCHDIGREDLRFVRKLYERLAAAGCRLQLATYFGSPEPWLSEVCTIPCDSLHFDLLYWTTTTAWLKTRAFPRNKQLSMGVVSGRNVWATPLWDRREELVGLVELYGADNLVLAPTCSLLHLPHDKTLERQWDTEFSSWVSFADQRIEELVFLKRALNGDKNVEALLKQRQAALSGRGVSTRVHRPEVKQAVARIEAHQSARAGAPPVRKPASAQSFAGLPLLPTSTVGSFPQTTQMRKTRQEWKRGKLTDEQYKKAMEDEIATVIALQEKLGLDVLVHGEVERGDMVEFFAEHWDGAALSTAGWVQSLGHRCVKPPLIFGDIRRRTPATVSWYTYAQSLTKKPVKAVLTGPVTLLNWSFVREDQGRQKTAYQIALALREEALDLEKAGARIVQIDEAALREGLPMMRVHWSQYLRWAVEAFHVVVSSLSSQVQLHVHLCYSLFADIPEVLQQLGADVLLVESARGGEDVLKRLKERRYSGMLGPGVFDVHARTAPDTAECEARLRQWLGVFPARQLWVNPDCGLKSMAPADAERSLAAMVAAAVQVRAGLRR